MDADQLAIMRASAGPDDLVYAPGGGFYPGAPVLWAIDPSDGSRRSVEPPGGVENWAVVLLWGPDGRLYAFGQDSAWAFTPDD